MEFDCSFHSGVTSYEDDFLSSGFHQFYTELNEDFCIENGNVNFVNRETKDPLVGQVHIEINNNSINYDQNVNENSVEISYLDLSNCNYKNFEQNYSEVVQNENEMFEISELEQILMGADPKNEFEFYENLPEKTFLCNDSCNIFLKESSENLKINSLKLQSKRESDDNSIQLQPTSTSIDMDADKVLYPCNYGQCQKVYAKPAHLKAHLRRHLGEED